MRMRVCVHICSHRGPSREGREAVSVGCPCRPREPGQRPSLCVHSKGGPSHGWRSRSGPEIPPRDSVSAPPLGFWCAHRGQCPRVSPHPFPVSVLTGIRRIPHCPSYFNDPTGTGRHSSHHEARGPEPVCSGPHTGSPGGAEGRQPGQPRGWTLRGGGREPPKTGLSADSILRNGRGAEGSPPLDVQGSRW